MNEARLNAASFHRAGEEMKIRISRDVAILEDELNAANLQRAWEERQIIKAILMVISQKCGNTYEES